MRQIDERISEFEKLRGRQRIIKEVSLDHQLMAEENPWELYLIPDFHEIFNVAFPRVVDIRSEVQKGEIVIRLSLRKKKEAEMFRDRLRRSIPFVGRIKVSKPILIPPYAEELQIWLTSQLQKQLREELKHRFSGMLRDVRDTKNQLSESIQELQTDPAEALPLHSDEQNLEGKVRDFTDSTIKGFYYISFLNATGLETLNHLLTFIADFPSEYESLLEDLNVDPWVESLEFRGRRFSNIIDAQALALVLRLNQYAQEQGKRHIYLLLSDSRALWKATQKFPDSDEEPLFPDGACPIIKSDMFPKYCRSDGIHILRTSYHFEEFVQSFDPDPKAQIEKLNTRRDKLMKELDPISFQVEELHRDCDRDLEGCPCQKREDKCLALRNSIDVLIRGGQKLRTLESIIKKEKAFEPLLEFSMKHLAQPVGPDVKKLQDVLSEVFFKAYDKTMEKKLDVALRIYEEESLANWVLLKNSIIPFAETSILVITHRLRRMEGLVFSVAFDRNETIKQLLCSIGKVGAGEAVTKEALLTVGRRHYSEILQIMTTSDDRVSVDLLTSIVLYCYDLYDRCGWVVRRSLENRIEELRQFNKETEFRYMLASAAARRCFDMRDKNAAKQKLTEICSGLEGYSRDHPQEARIPYLAGKLLARKHLFSIDGSDRILHLSIKQSQRALEILNSLDRETSEQLEVLKLPLKNNILWAITRLSRPTESLTKRAHELYGEIQSSQQIYQVVGTVASYHHMLALAAYDGDKAESQELFRQALEKLLFATKLGAKQSANKQENLALERDIFAWADEYKEKFKRQWDYTNGVDPVPDE